MGIPEIQKKRVFEEVSRSFFATGKKPRMIDVMNEVSSYFSKYPTGTPLPLPLDYLVSDLASNVEKMNDIMARFTLNLDVLYEATEEQIQEIMELNTQLRTHLERIRARRNKVTTVIDDHLFSLYNTDGYFYSVSDTFNDLDLVDLSLTSAFIDITANNVSIPTISSLTNTLPIGGYRSFDMSVTVDGERNSYTTVSPITAAVDGLNNTVWSSEVETEEPAEVVFKLRIDVGGRRPVKMSRLEFDPYGMRPVQMWVEVVPTEGKEDKKKRRRRKDFGGEIKSSPYAMAFVDQPVEVDRVVITLRKTIPDYTVQKGGKLRHRYIFGAKNISITEQVYDNEAILVSNPLSISAELIDDNVIDAVSLTADGTVIDNTEIEYYVASDVDIANPELTDFDWKRITPIDELEKSETNIVRFDGARSFVRYIRREPAENDMQLILENTTNADLKKRNPTQTILPGTNVYRLAKFEEQVLLPSLLLEEGVNTTRILHLPYDEEAQTLKFWKPYVKGTKTATVEYGRIDTGNEFFYGGDIGENGRSIYVETYLESDSDQELLLREFRKSDPNSRVWDVKVFLNGRKLGDLPIGVDTMVLPWKFQQGLNHIILLVTIPEADDDYPNAYVGLLDLMNDTKLFEFGTVKLATWRYVDFFQMKHNEVRQPFTFTIYDNEIVSRRKPTDNFRLRYAKATQAAPTAVRVRADLKRSVKNQYVTPVLDSYRLRFLYANR